MELILHEFGIAGFLKIHLHGLGVLVGDLVNPAVRAIGEIHLLVAGHAVIPIIDEDRTIRAVLRAEAAIPWISGHHEIAVLLRFAAGAAAIKGFVAQIVDVDIIEEKGIPILRRPRVAEIDHRPAVGAFLISEISDGGDVGISMRIERLTGLAGVAGPLDGLPHV